MVVTRPISKEKIDMKQYLGLFGVALLAGCSAWGAQPAPDQTMPAPAYNEYSEPAYSGPAPVYPQDQGGWSSEQREHWRHERQSHAAAHESQAQVSHGSWMFQVQERLKHLGYYEGVVDGQAGPATAAAVKHFQHDNKLHETGVVDADTDTALGMSAGNADHNTADHDRSDRNRAAPTAPADTK